MGRWKPATGKKKPQASKAGAVGCVMAIVLVLLFFIWSFSALLPPL